MKYIFYKYTKVTQKTTYNKYFTFVKTGGS